MNAAAGSREGSLGWEAPGAAPLSPRGDSRSAADRRTDYEAASGQKEIQRQLGISRDTDRLDKKRGLQGELAEGQERVAWARISPAPFGDFCTHKSHPGFGGGAPAAPPPSPKG